MNDQTNIKTYNKINKIKLKNMTSRDFAYWIQGFFELSNAETITKEQAIMIKKHLNLVFKHEIDPSMGDEKHQQELNDIHNQKVENPIEPQTKILQEGKDPKIESQFLFPKTEDEAVAKWGKKPSPKHKFNLHGWYDPAEGIPRC